MNKGVISALLLCIVVGALPINFCQFLARVEDKVKGTALTHKLMLPQRDHFVTSSSTILFGSGSSSLGRGKLSRLGLRPVVKQFSQYIMTGEERTDAELSDIQVIHPQFRKWPTPSSGIQAQNNPPIFLWPVAEEDRSTYDIRLSRDRNFKTITYSSENIPYAIYSPYEKMENGNWYWQYRVSKGKWSVPRVFSISEHSQGWDLPSPNFLKENIPAQHPRLLLKKNMDFHSFRKIIPQTKDVEKIIKLADQNLKRPLLVEELHLDTSDETDKGRLKKLRKDASKILGNTALTVVESLARAYVITGDEKYASGGQEWAMYVTTWDPDGVSSLNDFGDSRCMLSMAMAYDTFHERFSESEQHQLLKAIHARASRFYDNWINKIEAKVLSNHVWQHVFHYFFQTALATYGDIPEAELWIDYLYELFIARAPALGRADGAWVNGNNYFTMNMAVLLDVPLTIKDLTGFDFISHTKWYQNNPYYLWYSLPPHSSSDGFGDNSKGFVQPSKAYIAYADMLGKITGNEYAKEYAEEARKGTNIEVTDDSSLRWIRLKYLSGLKVSKNSEIPDLPRARIFPDAGMVYMNSNPQNTTENLMIAMRSSPFGSYGHMLADQNAFNILYGGKPLFFHSGHKISMDDPHRQKWYKNTRSHNGILINDHGQPYSTEAFGWIPRFIDGQYLSYAMGDASQAYNTIEHGGQVDYGLKKYYRHILMLYPDIIVIYDELESDNPAEWSWLLHSPGDLELNQDNNHFLFTSTDISSRVDVFGSTDIQWKVTNKYDIPAENWRGKKDEKGQYVDFEDDDWHLTGISSRTREMRFLTVFQVRSDSELLPVSTEGHGQFLCGDWNIMAELDSQKYPVLEVFRNDGNVAFVSGKDEIHLGENVFKGGKKNSAKLVEMIGGEPIFKESVDEMPSSLQAALKQSTSQ